MPTIESAPVDVPARIVEQTRLIRASRARIFAAWTDPVLLQQWFGAEERICTLAEADARVGGAYRIGMRLKDKPDAQASIASGHYTKVVQNKLLQFQWIPSWNPAEKSLVTVTLEAVHGGTEVTIRHEHFPPESYDSYSCGWNGCLTALARAVEHTPAQ